MSAACQARVSTPRRGLAGVMSAFADTEQTRMGDRHDTRRGIG
jgi:hypothetical protein